MHIKWQLSLQNVLSLEPDYLNKLSVMKNIVFKKLKITVVNDASTGNRLNHN